jgi:hypothetical protein
MNIRFDLTILVDDLQEFNQNLAEQEMIRWLNSLKKIDVLPLDNELNN